MIISLTLFYKYQILVGMPIKLKKSRLIFYNFFYSGILSGHIIVGSPRTFPQFLIGIVHFFVALKVAKYNAFNNACKLVNTLLCRVRRRYDALNDSIAFVVWKAVQTSFEILNISETASRFSFHRFIACGYKGPHFSVTNSSCFKAFFSSGLT